MHIKTLLFYYATLLALTLGTTVASAELSIERNISITDDTGGTLVMLSIGTRDDLGGESSTTASFTNFQAAPDRRRVAGEVVRERVRSAQRVQTTYNGGLEIFSPATDERDERVDTLVFENLTVVREGENPELSGSVIYNGQMLEAAKLPRPALRMLARALRFFHFA